MWEERKRDFRGEGGGGERLCGRGGWWGWTWGRCGGDARRGSRRLGEGRCWRSLWCGNEREGWGGGNVLSWEGIERIKLVGLA